MPEDAERLACTPHPIDPRGFKRAALLPHGLTVEHIASAMEEFTLFLGYINQQLGTRGILRLEAMVMAANFSSIVGEFMVSTIPKYCVTLVKNRHHNGHPDLVPSGRFLNDAAQHADEGIEVKGSRYDRGWQGPNPEDTSLMVFVFDSNRPPDRPNGIAPRPFRFIKVIGARPLMADWRFSGRSETSRRTMTASVMESGFQKMEANWIYRDRQAIRRSLKGTAPP